MSTMATTGTDEEDETTTPFKIVSALSLYLSVSLTPYLSVSSSYVYSNFQPNLVVGTQTNDTLFPTDSPKVEYPLSEADNVKGGGTHSAGQLVF